MKFYITLELRGEEIAALQSLFLTGGNLPDHVAHLRHLIKHPVDPGHEMSVSRELQALENAISVITNAR